MTVGWLEPWRSREVRLRRTHGITDTAPDAFELAGGLRRVDVAGSANAGRFHESPMLGTGQRRVGPGHLTKPRSAFSRTKFTMFNDLHASGGAFIAPCF